MVTPAKYVDLKVPALRDMCAERDLDNTGLRRDLMARLERKDRVVEEREREVRLRGREMRGEGGAGYRATAIFGRRQEDERLEGDEGLGRQAEHARRGAVGRGIEQREQGGDRVRKAEFSPGTTQQQNDFHSFQHRSKQRTPEPRSDPRQNRMYSAPAPPHRQIPDNIPHPHDDPSIMHLSEAELADILVANYTPFDPDRNGYDRRAKIRAEHDVKLDEARKKKDTAIARAVTKYNTEVDKLKVEREAKYEELESDLSARREKDQRWNPAFARLKVLRAPYNPIYHVTNIHLELKRSTRSPNPSSRFRTTTWLQPTPPPKPNIQTNSPALPTKPPSRMSSTILRILDFYSDVKTQAYLPTSSPISKPRPRGNTWC
ncbi:hypothetical protein DL98DRAFT_587361 [Cadophora sp. DSE1049]|nr:hypothetical protein DL98DRAFT_587361 [Cadophora sp. DSE1049]